ncbi:MAG: hypothetical protein EPN40_09685 [Rhodanobacteraceae bacterium]|nr:MAG: hypothetical protein EPN40_09685 [Rhodanobacteraceae bacterium]
MGSRGFWLELKRRHVYRVAVAYAVVGWLLIEVATQVFPVFHMPDWTDQLVVLLIVIGFPVALILAWAFEMTPEGVRRTEPANSEAARLPEQTHYIGRRLNAVIMGVLVLAVAVLLWQKFASSNMHPETAPAIAKATQMNAGSPPVRPAASAIPAKSIAVLPFVNLSGDPKQEYFSDGITEEILNALAQIPVLKVAGRTSAFQFNSKDGDLRKIGETLGVANVLEGSVQKAGDEVRITVQLVDTRSGYQLWSENYDRKLTSIFAIEDEISNAIASKLRAQWHGGTARPLVAQQTVDPSAHDFYLRGLDLLAARGPRLLGAFTDFQNSIAIQPDYADAWGALAETQALLPSYYLEPEVTAYPAAQSSAQRALTIDPKVALAYVALGYVHRGRWEWAQADVAFQRALQLAPGAAETNNQYAQFLLASGQFHQALIQVERAHQLDPLSGIIGVIRADIFIALHRFDEAEAQIKTTIAAHPDYALARFVAAEVAIYRHDYPVARAQFRVAAGLVGETDTYSSLVDGIANPGKRQAAIRLVEETPISAHWELDKYERPMWLAWLGDREGALKALEKFSLSAVHSEAEPWQPALDPIRKDPRFMAALKKMGLPYIPRSTGASP